MPIAVSVVLFVFWIAVAFREFQRGDMLLAGVFLLVGVVMTAYRVSVANKLAKAKVQTNT